MLHPVAPLRPGRLLRREQYSYAEGDKIKNGYRDVFADQAAGRALREERIAQGLTVAEASVRLGVPVDLIPDLERGAVVPRMGYPSLQARLRHEAPHAAEETLPPEGHAVTIQAAPGARSINAQSLPPSGTVIVRTAVAVPDGYRAGVAIRTYEVPGLAHTAGDSTSGCVPARVHLSRYADEAEGEVFRTERLRLRLSLSDAARCLGIGVASVCALERGALVPVDGWAQLAERLASGR